MAIKITYYSETIDNWGRQESSHDGKTIHRVLTDVEGWTDDMEFEDSNGNIHLIDDLVGKEVEVEGIGKFTVPTDN
jgi:hypothetical protein